MPTCTGIIFHHVHPRTTYPKNSFYLTADIIFFSFKVIIQNSMHIKDILNGPTLTHISGFTEGFPQFLNRLNRRYSRNEWLKSWPQNIRESTVFLSFLLTAFSNHIRLKDRSKKRRIIKQGHWKVRGVVNELESTWNGECIRKYVEWLKNWKVRGMVNELELASTWSGERIGKYVEWWKKKQLW